MKIPKLSIVTHFYNQHDLVQLHIEQWKSLPDDVVDQLEFICVDDFSSEEIKINKGNLNLRLFKVIDDIDWNMPGCKNLGAFMSKSDWIIFFDIDNFIEPNGFTKILNAINQLDARTLYRFNRTEQGERVDSHINTLLLHKKEFFEIGGLDEDFSGHYGYEDVHFNLLWNNKIGSSTLITDIEFLQSSTQTKGLDRNTDFNQRLISRKIHEENYSNSVGKIRFNWIEVNLT